MTSQCDYTISLRFSTPAGEIIGWQDQNVIRATGIRYAQAKRFQPPTPEPPAQAPIMATKLSPVCPQAAIPWAESMLGNFSNGLTLDEHCQYLSVTLPANLKTTDRLPVMVWIHGGSYISGAGDAAIFDPSAMVEEQQIIFVAVTYRLGLFGFLGGYADRAANLGLLDIIEALRWVKKNISAFGGDPDCITLFGESAGGDAIAHLMIAEGAQDLFQRAIIQSAPLGISRGREKMAAAMAAVAAQIPVDASAEQMVEWSRVVAAAARKFGWVAGMPFGTQYGYSPLPVEEEIDTAWSRNATRYNVLIGNTAEEATFFLSIHAPLQRFSRLPLLGNLFRRIFVSTVTQKIYGLAAEQFAHRHAQAGGRAYLYKITWGSKQNGIGAGHAIDLPLLFGNADTWRNAYLVKGLDWSEILHNAQRVRALWATFARNGQLAEKGTIEPAVLTYRRV